MKSKIYKTSQLKKDSEFGDKAIIFGSLDNARGHQLPTSHLILRDKDVAHAITQGETLKSIAEDLELGTENPRCILITLNPIILNWLSDEFAIKNLFYVTPDQKIKPFFDEQNLFKLDVLGPGEAVCDDARINHISG